MSFRFVLETPQLDGSGPKSKKRARLVTACDSCRLKKVKCIQTPGISNDAKCDACHQANAPCAFSDRDRYQAERGLVVTPLVHDPSVSAQPSGPADSGDSKRRKRRRRSSTEPTQPLAPTLPPPPPVRLELPSKMDLAADSSSPITSQQAPAQLKRIIVPFFRWYGPTSNTPGYRRVKVRTLTLPDDSSSTSQSTPTSVDTTSVALGSGVSTTSEDRPSTRDTPSSLGGSTLFNPTTNPDAAPDLPLGLAGDDGFTFSKEESNNSQLFDPSRPRYPNPRFLPHLATLFFDHLACHFPFLDRVEILKKVKDGTLSAILANCIAALAIRFSDQEELLVDTQHLAGEPYCDMAKLLVVHMLSWPSLEVLQALLLIAWAEFGSGRDSGLWMYSRMAIGMAMDLGLGFEATVQLAGSEEEKENIRLTWWAAVLIDRINSWGTGRPIAIADNQFDTAVPTCDPSVYADPNCVPPHSFVYGHLCRLVQLRGKMGDVLNNLIKRKPDQYPVDMELSELQSQMTSFYHSLPPTLVFNIQNFRRFSRCDQAAVFLLLHVMFHSVITLLHRPSLLRDFTPNVALPLANNVDLSRSSARSIVDMVMLANEVDEEALLANPFLDLPILTAGRAFLAERESIAKPPSNMSSVMIMFMLQWGENSLEKCKDVLGKMSHFWGGVGCVKMILEQQSVGSMDFDVGEGAAPDSRIASLRDVELIRQWAASAWRRQRPHGTQPPVVKPPPSSSDAQSQSRAPSSASNLNPPTSSSVPLLPVDHNSAQYGPTTGTIGGDPDTNAASSTFPAYLAGSSPDGTAIGITGYLDGPLVSSYNSASFDAFNSQNALGPESNEAALRISFNAAEAELSFSGMSTSELFSIPDGFEEFLASHMQGAPWISSGGGTGGGAASGGGETAMELGTGASNGFTGVMAGLDFPAFSSLGLPMQHLSRASSPTHR